MISESGVHIVAGGHRVQKVHVQRTEHFDIAVVDAKALRGSDEVLKAHGIRRLERGVPVVPVDLIAQLLNDVFVSLGRLCSRTVGGFQGCFDLIAISDTLGHVAGFGHLVPQRRAVVCHPLAHRDPRTTFSDALSSCVWVRWRATYSDEDRQHGQRKPRSKPISQRFLACH